MVVEQRQAGDRVKTRRRVGKRLDQRLQDYYGDRRCVAALEGGLGDWHHLDDDPSNTRFANLVALEGRYNKALEAAHLRRQRNAEPVVVPPEVSPGLLLARARQHRARWNNGKAYGAARLASFVAREYLDEPPDQVLGYVTETIRHLRHRFDSALLEDVVRRDVLPALAGPGVSRATAVRMVYQLGCVYGDYGYRVEAAEIYDRIEPHLGPGRIDTGWYANARRRHAQLDDDTAYAIKDLEDTFGIARWDADLTMAIEVTIAWRRAAAGDRGGMDRSREALEPYRKLVTRPLRFDEATGLWRIDEDAMMPFTGNTTAHYLATMDLLQRKTGYARRGAMATKEGAQAAAVFRRLSSELAGDTGVDWSRELSDYDAAHQPRGLPRSTRALLHEAVGALLAA